VEEVFSLTIFQLKWALMAPIIVMEPIYLHYGRESGIFWEI